MAQQLTYELRTRQTTILTPRLQHSVKLLQMSTLDFNREVADAIANNPFLETTEETSNDTAMPDQEPLPVTTDTPPEPGDSVPEAEVSDAYVDPPSSYSGDYPTPRKTDAPESDVGQWARSSNDLHDILRHDLCGYHLNEREQYLVEYIIEALDDDGYLRTPFDELAPQDQFNPRVQPEEWHTALKLVQQLSTPGLAARDLAECLNLQLHALPDQEVGKAIALDILQRGMDRLARCDYTGLARQLNYTEEEIHAACCLLRTLNPRPGARYKSLDPSCYVIPDVVVRKVGKLWVATSNHEAVPQARLNTVYAQLFRQARSQDRAPMSQALQEARWLMRSLEQRTTTIQLVAQAIVARQQTFFDYGEIALRPMMLSEIADELGMHESTISRATSNKYLASPRGIFEFKLFFSRELTTRTGGTCSAVSVRARIQELITAENPKQPLSDVVLTSKLALEGIIVARRTVSKYRTQINQPPAEMRRAP
ncbi:MAG: RNA polymerase factor sigma-54 [Burkholderiaceae bacterium]|nr:RNA polymerase factor sigma-54 [Burkholderiaceae bacterium]